MSPSRRRATGAVRCFAPRAPSPRSVATPTLVSRCGRARCPHRAAAPHRPRPLPRPRTLAVRPRNPKNLCVPIQPAQTLFLFLCVKNPPRHCPWRLAPRSLPPFSPPLPTRITRAARWSAAGPPGSRRLAPPRGAAWQVAHAEHFAGASPCAPHSRAGRGVRSPLPQHGCGTAPPSPPTPPSCALARPRAPVLRAPSPPLPIEISFCCVKSSFLAYCPRTK